jgi:CubicO group peptidase (beta-lactamase class C family)
MVNFIENFNKASVKQARTRAYSLINSGYLLSSMKFSILIISLLLFRSSLKAQDNTATGRLSQEIEAEAKYLQKILNVPGLSVAVVEGDRVILCKGFGLSNIEKNIPFDAHTAARLASATKFFTSIGILSEVNKGIIDLNAPLKTYLTDVPAAWENIPLYMLLNLTSGIPGTEKTPFDQLEEDQQRKVSEQDLYDFLKKLPLESKPGEKWDYRQTGYMIAAMIISQRTGKTWPEVLKETMLTPAGMINTGHNDLTVYPAGLLPKNYVYNNTGQLINSPMFFPAVLATGAGYNTSASDLANLFLAINQGRILSPELISKYEFNKTWMYPLGPGQYYSIASELKTFGPYLTIGHSGGPDLANIRYSPDRKIGVAVLANRNTTGISEELTNRILKRMLQDSAFSKQSQPISYEVIAMVKKSSYEQLVGFYGRAKTNKKYSFTDAESLLNNGAYELMNSHRLDDALKVFRLIVHEYPNSANAYDSLGEAYLANGNRDSALINYKKSLKLNPANDNAKKIIDRF